MHGPGEVLGRALSRPAFPLAPQISACLHSGVCRPIMAAQLPPTEGFFGVGSFLDGMDGKV